MTSSSIPTNVKDIKDLRANERFHMYPEERLKSIAIIGGAIGGFSGFYEGIKTSSLRYLIENGHRLPRNVGGWYFYHKKKNYVMIKSGFLTGMKLGVKYSFMVSSFFGLEWIFDTYVRNNTIDCLNTMASSGIFFTGYGMYRSLSKSQVINYARRGTALGLSVGIAQDLMIWSRGGHVWYLNKLGLKRFQD